MTKGVVLMTRLCLVLPELLRDSQINGDRIKQERSFYHLVLDVTMEASFIQLVPPVMVDG